MTTPTPHELAAAREIVEIDRDTLWGLADDIAAIIAKHRSEELLELQRKVEFFESGIKSPTWPHVLRFAVRMEKKLEANRHKGNREGWLKDDPWSLVERILDETVEVQQCFTEGSDGRIDYKDAEELADECADVANFCMMVADRVTYIESAMKEQAK